MISVIVLENDGTEYGVNGWAANEKRPTATTPTRAKEKRMSNEIEELLAAEAEAR